MFQDQKMLTIVFNVLVCMLIAFNIYLIIYTHATYNNIEGKNG